MCAWLGLDWNLVLCKEGARELYRRSHVTSTLPLKGNFYSLWGSPIKGINQTQGSCLQSTGEDLFHQQCASEHILQTFRLRIFSLSRDRVIWFWPLLGNHSWPTSTDHLPRLVNWLLPYFWATVFVIAHSMFSLLWLLFVVFRNQTLSCSY